MDVYPSTKKTLQNLFIIFLVALSFGGGVFVTKLYFDGLVGQKNEEYEVSKETLRSQISSLELEHSKEVSLLKSEYERQLKQKVVTEVAKDGSSKQVIETESNESQVVIKEVIKEVEVEKLVYVDRVVEIEKIVYQESFVSPASRPSWSLGISASPSLNVPYATNFSLDLGYSVTENFGVFTSLDTDLTFRLGFRFRF